MHQFRVSLTKAYAEDYGFASMDVHAENYEVEMCGALTFIGTNQTTHAFLSLPPGSWLRVEEINS